MNKKNKKEDSLVKAVNNARNLTENYRGVTLDIVKLRNNKEKIFRTRIVNKGTTYSLGYHDNVFEAALAYNKKAKSLFGGEKKAKNLGRWNVI